jgi:hypothetical protein
MKTHETEHMTLADFETAVARMRDGDAIAEGFIAYALYQGNLRGENIGHLTQLQMAAYRLYQQHELHLTQRRLGENRYEYIATKAPKCPKPTR